jgi:hypothetical protein
LNTIEDINSQILSFRGHQPLKIPPTASKLTTKMESAIFKYFPLLPLELQQLIWRYALPLFPRIVTVRPFVRSQEMVESSSESISNVPKWVLTTSNIPTLLSINRESRQELLRFYNISFDPISARSIVPNLKFSCLTDTLYVDLNHSLHTQLPIPGILEEIFTPSSYILLKKQLRNFAGSTRFWVAALATISVKALESEFQNVDDWELAVVERDIVNPRLVIGFEEVSPDVVMASASLMPLFCGIKRTPGGFEKDVRVCMKITGVERLGFGHVRSEGHGSNQ